MKHNGKIIIGLIIFLVLITLPIWYNMATGDNDRPEVEVLTKNIPGKDKCVMPAEEMRAKHMDLVVEWREKVVREGERIHTTPDGRKFNMSLTHTCLDCHSNKAQFCDKCHDYTGVKPYCWTCHIDPKEVNR